MGQQRPGSFQFYQCIVLRVDKRTAGFASQIQHALAEVDSNLTVIRVNTMPRAIGGLLRHERLIACWPNFSDCCSTAGVGWLYGSTAYAVAQRTSEIALTAARRDCLNVSGYCGECLSQVGLGLVSCIPAAMGAGRALAGQLYGVKASDPLVLGGGAILLAASPPPAAFIPACAPAASIG